LRENTIRTGKAFYEISKIVDDIRLLCYAQSDFIDQSSQIEICISDHLIWKWRVYNMILGNVVFDDSVVGTHQTCRLGKWAAKQDKSDSKISEIITALEKPHSLIHELAKNSIKQFNAKDIRSSEESLKMMDVQSQEVIRLLRKLKEVI
jgi:methyl-accepting chemotaxis protein